tara:strand:- start:137 stop:499 length:363 start_codon:yes stop_codon:yes gene_type:complete
MKKLLLLLFSLFFLSSPSVFAENITCSYIWDNEANFFTLERSTNNFLWKTSGSYNYLEILHESKDFLVLGEMFVYGSASDIDAYYVLFLNKKTKKFRSRTIYDPLLDHDGNSSTGKCQVD